MSSESTPPAHPSKPSPRPRFRTLCPNVLIGRHPTGPLNSLTDVPHVHVSTQSIHQPNTDTSHAINTGLTCIMPRRDCHEIGSRAGVFRFNGSGELTGSHWLEETGLLNSPVVLTNSFSVGACYDGIYKYSIREYGRNRPVDWFLLPVVGETYDGMTSDIASMAVKPEMVVEGIDMALKDGKGMVYEGCTGGGTGMLTHGFKSGTGSASRLIRGKVRIDGKEEKSEYTVGALVQSNYGKAYDLKFAGVPIGRLMMSPEERKEQEKNLNGYASGQTSKADLVELKGPPKDGSIIVVLATDAPLSAIQLQRLAKRATVGVARVGGWGSNSSGDVFLAFSTAHGIPRNRKEEDGQFEPVVNQLVQDLQDETINGLFEAASDAVEESIYNALCGATDTIGPGGTEWKAIDQEKLKELMDKHYAR